MSSRSKRLIKLLKILIKADHLYTDEQIRDMKSQLRVIEEEVRTEMIQIVKEETEGCNWDAKAD